MRTKEEKREYNRKYYQENKEHIKAHVKEYLRKDPERTKVRRQIWREKYYEYVLHQCKLHRARKRNAKGSYTLEEWTTLLKQYNHTCPACNKRKPLTEDHIVPVSKGGSNYINNIQPLCKSCNCSKGTKTIKYKLTIKEKGVVYQCA